MNGGLPAVSTFSAPTATYGSVASHTPPVSGAESLMGMTPSLHPDVALVINNALPLLGSALAPQPHGPISDI